MGSKIHVAKDLTTYFKGEVQTAAEKQGLEATPATFDYLANVLSRFSNIDALMIQTQTETLTGEKTSRTLPVLAQMFFEGFTNPITEQLIKFQQLGDVALFTSGFLSERVKRSIVDLDYYVSMGEMAYDRAGKIKNSLSSQEHVVNVYFELSRSFPRFVEVLAELADKSLLANDKDTLKLYEKWLESKSFRISRMLAEVGVIPQDPNKPGKA